MNRPMPKASKDIIEVPINKVILWKDNPRKNDAAVPKVAEIFKVRGQINPVVVWKENNVCYAGNTRLKAAKMLGWKTVKVLYVDFPSEAAAIAYGIADNKSSEWSEWDDSVLMSFLNDTKVQNEHTGFNIKDSGLFDVSVNIDTFSGIADLLKVKSLMGLSLLSILAHACIHDKKISVSNLDSVFSLDCPEKDGLINLTVLGAVGKIAPARTSGLVSDFPKLIDKTKTIPIPKEFFHGIGSYLPFCAKDQTRASLCDVNFSKAASMVFGTDGTKGKFRYLKNLPKDFRIDAIAASIIDYLYDRVNTVEMNDSNLFFIGEKFMYSCKYTADGVVDFSKVIPKSTEKDFVAIDNIIDTIKKISPCSGTRQVVIDPEQGIALPGMFFVDQKVTMKKSVFNIDNLMLTMRSKIFQTGDEKQVLFTDDHVEYFLVMPLRAEKSLFDKCSGIPAVKLPFDTAEGTELVFDYEVAGNTVRGKIKGISKEACRLFVERNFKNAKLR